VHRHGKRFIYKLRTEKRQEKGTNPSETMLISCSCWAISSPWMSATLCRHLNNLLVILILSRSQVGHFCTFLATGYSNQPQSISTSPLLLLTLVLAALSNLPSSVVSAEPQKKMNSNDRQMRSARTRATAAGQTVEEEQKPQQMNKRTPTRRPRNRPKDQKKAKAQRKLETTTS
jgi:hypothetical protein